MKENLQKATLAGGCFWCTEAIFKRIKGVESVMVGYTGGNMENPSYGQVGIGTTNHAEAIQVFFDPQIISYEKILEIFWKTHDPTSLNRQGADVGTQYRSAIFYHDEKQKNKALELKNKLQDSGVFKESIVTEIVPFTKFYKAEEYHQNYYSKNSYQPYCQIVIDPKIQKLYQEFGSEVKEEMVY